MNTHVGVYAKDGRIFEQLKLAAQVSNFIIHEAPSFADYKEDHFVVCDVETFLEKKKDFNKIKRPLLYVVSDKSDEENMRLIEEHDLEHLVGFNDQIFGSEIVNHLQKTFNRKIWGLKSYMADDAELKILSLSDSKHTNEMVQEALGHFDFKDYFSSPVEYMQVMANELISNSLYKGPNRKRQDQGLDMIDRRSPVFLKGSDLVQVTLGMDQKGVALSVQDSFGGLTYELLIKSLIRSFEEKTVMEKKDGAGLGLYLTFLHSNQFIINFRQNFRTEVICIIEKNKRYKNYKQRIRSFHFFQEVPSEKTNNQ
jgi:sigma-B regulation protein RsbU (phosphoserine phosphatase)